MLKVIAVEDDQIAHDELVRQIKMHRDLELVGSTRLYREAQRMIHELRPDAAFLDIELAGHNTMSLIENVTNPPMLVFVTAHSRYAVKAFDLAAIDFLIKPLSAARFAATVRRLQEAAHLSSRILTAANQLFDVPVVTVNSRQSVQRIKSTEIQALIADAYCTRLLLKSGGSVLAGQSLGKLLSKLPSPPFVRLTRSLVLNLQAVKQVQSMQASKVTVLLDGQAEPLELGRAATQALRKVLARE